MTDSSTGRCAGRYVDPLRHDADDVGWMVNHTPLLSRRTGAGHEVDRNIRLVPGFRFVEKLRVIGQNVCPFWLVFLCGSGRFSCSSCMGGELEVGQNVCPEWPVRPCGTTVE